MPPELLWSAEPLRARPPCLPAAWRLRGLRWCRDAAAAAAADASGSGPPPDEWVAPPLLLPLPASTASSPSPLLSDRPTLRSLLAEPRDPRDGNATMPPDCLACSKQGRLWVAETTFREHGTFWSSTTCFGLVNKRHKIACFCLSWTTWRGRAAALGCKLHVTGNELYMS